MSTFVCDRHTFLYLQLSMWSSGLFDSAYMNLKGAPAGFDLREVFLTNMEYNIRPIISMTTHQPKLSIRGLAERDFIQAG